MPPQKLEEEFKLVQQAFFTDPEDQSAYIYHRWLLNESLACYEASKGTAEEDNAKKVPSLQSPICPPCYDPPLAAFCS